LVRDTNYVKIGPVMVKAKVSDKSPVPSAGLLDALAQAAFTTMAILNRLAADNDLSLTQLRVAGILRDRRLRMVELARYLGLEKSTVTGLVDRAEKRGLMARAANADDGRASDVFLTKDGLKLAARMEAQLQEAMLPLTARLNASEQRLLQSLLERLLASD
jgi:DNA-binding MarR family transcriptional regulator